MEKISVVIPVYNVENFISDCVESLQRQTYKNFEAIFVNDGSLDNSISLIRKAIKVNDNFKIVNKENGGLSSARNYGLNYVTGDYITFLDSDDFLSEKFLEVMINNIGDNDICCCGYKEIRENSGFIKDVFNLENRRGGGDDFGEIIKAIDFIPNAWGKLYKKDVFESIKYPEGMLFEDFAILQKVFFGRKFIIVNEPLYYYRIRSGSIMRTYNPKVISDKIFILNQLREFLYENNCYFQFKDAYIDAYLYHGFFVTSCILINQGVDNVVQKLHDFYGETDKGILSLGNIIKSKSLDLKVKFFLILLLSPKVAVIVKNLQNKFWKRNGK